MIKKVLEYYNEASYRAIRCVQNDTPVQAPYSVHYFFEKVLDMLDSAENELKKHKLLWTFLSRTRNVWEDLYLHDPEYASSSGAGIADPLLAEVKPHLNGSQFAALKIAEKEPISLIQGPPGTGKTHMILALLYVLTQKLSKSVAVVSVNNEAIENITDEIQYNNNAKPYIRALEPFTAKLGNSGNKEAYNNSPTHDSRFTFESGNGGCYLKSVPGIEVEKEFRSKYRIISSTPHSLMKLFRDSYSADAMYDYVIVDETSQMNSMLGLISMFAARHLVLVGDDQQIPPIILEDKYRDIGLYDNYSRIFELKEDRSFLQVVSHILRERFEDIYGAGAGARFDSLNTVLTWHYRCLPGIFNFCRENFYNTAGMTIQGEKPAGGNVCPMKFIFYRGSFNEKCYIGKAKWRKNGNNLAKVPYDDSNMDNAAEQVSMVRSFYPDREVWKEKSDIRTSSRNMRQIQIFLSEEWKGICEGISRANKEGGSFSVCILSPYKAQIYELKERLVRLLNDTGSDRFPVNSEWPLDPVVAKDNIDQDSWHDFVTMIGPVEEENDNDPSGTSVSSLIIKDTKSLTIHSAQGQGFDKVYLLPVDDRSDTGSVWEPPFAQQGHLINVAVSRAKKEFCLIASAELMDEDMMGQYGIVPDGVKTTSPSTAAQRYVDVLIRYIYDAYDVRKHDPYFATPTSTLTSMYGFHETDVHTVFEIPDNDVREWATENDITLLSDEGTGTYGMSKDEARVAMFLEMAKVNLGVDVVRQYPLVNNSLPMDFAIRKNGEIICFIEEDGSVHRYRNKEQNESNGFDALKRLINDTVNSYKARDIKCDELGIRLFRWCSDTSHMIARDGSESAEKSRRKAVLKEAVSRKWDPAKPWQDQIEKFYEYVELEKLVNDI